MGRQTANNRDTIPVKMSLTFIDVAHSNQRPFDFYTNTISSVDDNGVLA
jgi:hypothetical protein